MSFRVSPAPMDVLPTELLMEIFVFCASNSDYTLTPITLTCVCRFWRDVVLGLPRAWQWIHLDDKRRSIAHSRQQAEIWLARSAPLSFDVQLQLHDSDMLLPLLSPLLPEIRRWKVFTMTGVRQEFFRLSSLGESNQDQSMNHLHIDIEEPDEDDVVDDIPGNTFTTCYGPWMHHLSMHIWVLDLPQAPLVAPLCITSLNICESSLDTHTQPVHLLEFLTACPELETLHFTSWPRDSEHNERTPPIVSLPRLRSLHLISTCSARTILSNLDTPILEEIYLAHLNVSFRLQDEFHEDGDSDDEAHDYSQSPSSDQATGMGLRKLITRCNPPVEVLEMDYSDMRTKDFRWCFDRLTKLREFRIVASDMSDRVINLLRPFRLPWEGKDVPLHIRLPNLENLELYNCQRLSGEALTEAIRTRVRYTDAMTPKSTLTEVSIIGCVTFEPWHAEVLAEDLGTRLRV